MLATVCNSVSRADFSAKRVLESWPILFGSVDVSEALGCCSDPGDSSTIQHHRRCLPNIPIPAGIPRPKLQQPLSRVCVLKPLPPLILSTEQGPTIPAKPLEILAEEAIRTIRADGGEEQSETDTEHEDSHQGAAPRSGVVSMSSVSSPSPSGWAFELFVLRDVSIPPGTPCPAYLGHQRTLPANTRTLPNLGCHTHFSHSGRHADGCRSHNIQQRSIHVWCTATPGQHTDGCSHAQVSPLFQTLERQATKIPLVSVRLEPAHSGSHAKGFFSKRVVF